jgi:hypothetical protein
MELVIVANLVPLYMLPLPDHLSLPEANLCWLSSSLFFQARVGLDSDGDKGLFYQRAMQNHFLWGHGHPHHSLPRITFVDTCENYWLYSHSAVHNSVFWIFLLISQMATAALSWNLLPMSSWNCFQHSFYKLLTQIPSPFLWVTFFSKNIILKTFCCLYLC